jgi:enamine deaminase RidA (YjgF/YER057c/UK114 family)
MGDAYSRFEALGLRLIPAGAPVGNFLPDVKVGNLLFLAGQGPRDHDGTFKTGRQDQHLSLDEGPGACAFK